MTVFVKPREDGSWEIRVENEPEFCRALPMRPQEMETELHVGFWLVLLIAVWSVPDRTAIQQALDAVKPYGGVVKLGIGPFDKHVEISRWIIGVKEKWGSPVWLMLHNGRVLDEKVGLLKQEDITRMIQSSVDRSAD